MNDRPKPIADATSAQTAGDSQVSTPPHTARTIDLEATSAYQPEDTSPRATRRPEIPGYELVRELGRGAFGTVYFGHAKDRPQTPLAIKAIEGQGNVDRLLVEPALLSRIKHPNVVGLESHFVHDGRLVLAMEYVPGGDLKAQLDGGVPFSAHQVQDFLVQIASALAEAHAQHIVHRDLKPSNVLIDSSGLRVRYVLADFGVGRTAEGVQSEKNVGGTFLYMAPEQLLGRPGPQSDLWAVGVIAYQMLTGKLPFPGSTVQELARQIQYTDPPPPSAVTGQALPGQLEETVLGLLRKSLSERTASARELLGQLGVRAEVKEPTAPKHRTGERALPIAEKLRRSARRALILLIATLVVYMLFNGVGSGILVLGGLTLFYHAQAHVERKGRRALLTVLAFLILSPRLVASFVPQVAYIMTLGVGPTDNEEFRADLGEAAANFGISVEAILGMIVVLVIVLSVVLPVVGSAAYANLRRARREQALLESALAGHTGSDEHLRLMRDMLNNRFEDVGFHLRYAELLYARGDHRGAAVEARLITAQDPYHFNANLLLANAYFALGLEDECKQVCDEYLEVTGYSFEFQELRDQCSRSVVSS